MAAARRRRGLGSAEPLDRDTGELPPEFVWREWMGVVEAVIFASPEPVPRETLAGLVGPACRLDELIADIQDELRGRPYELTHVAGGWQHRTRPRYAGAIRSVLGQPDRALALTATETLVVTAIAYLQPVSRAGLARMLGREVLRDIVARLKRLDLVASGPRLPQIGAPLTYVMTSRFLSVFGFGTLRDLPDLEALEGAGLLERGAGDGSSDDLDNALGFAPSDPNDAGLWD